MFECASTRFVTWRMMKWRLVVCRGVMWSFVECYWLVFWCHFMLGEQCHCTHHVKEDEFISSQLYVTRLAFVPHQRQSCAWHKYTYAYIYNIHTHTHIFIIHTHAYMYASIHTYISTYIYICTYTCSYVHTCTCSHTFI